MTERDVVHAGWMRSLYKQMASAPVTAVPYPENAPTGFLPKIGDLVIRSQEAADCGHRTKRAAIKEGNEIKQGAWHALLRAKRASS